MTLDKDPCGLLIYNALHYITIVADLQISFHVSFFFFTPSISYDTHVIYCIQESVLRLCERCCLFLFML